jgi:protein-tyrosine phosphatase
MQSRMGGSLSYEHDRGMNYTRITPQLIVGSCLQSQRDAQLLRKFEKVRSVLCLQQDSDMAYFDLDLDPVLLGCDEAGIDHLRFRVNDFDPYHLRLMLPDGVALLAKAMQNCKQDECVYVHCTAGLGRAPGIAIAYMYWVLGMSLTEAHQTLTSKRPCHPKLEAIANATGDLLFGRALQKVKVGMKAPVSVQSVHVAGLDMGWDNPLPCKREGDRFVLERELPTGRWQYKFIVDGRWTYNADSPTVNDNGSVNNYCDVMGELADEDRRRLVLPEPKITSQEREKLKQELAKITPKNS